MDKTRVLGERTGNQHGPLLIIFAQIHGNEPAGFHATHELFEAIDAEYTKNKNFDFRGKIVALQGNKRASELGVRFIDKDLNRSWIPEHVEKIKVTDNEELEAEDIEIKENLELIHHYIQDYQPTRLILLDLHTTTAHGGLFIIPAVDEESRKIALHMHAPVLHGFLNGLKGTTLHYFNTENMGIYTTSICFEAGQHNNPESIQHAVSAIISCFTAAEGFYPEDIETKHEVLLLSNAHGLPREGNLVHVHRIKDGDDFKMRPDKVYKNFDPIQKGELIANDKNGEIYSDYTGSILMPLYQKQGDDGFFVIVPIVEAGRIDKRKILKAKGKTQFI